MFKSNLSTICATSLLGSCIISQSVTGEENRPNIITIMVDDMGYSDLGCYGGEIETPNIDKLAKSGVRFSNFYNNARCCPTRASLMTGLAPHMTGIGHMTVGPEAKSSINMKRPPAYQGKISKDCLTVAELLKPAGYATMITGKWHLGYHDKACWPSNRGFEYSYSSIAGATHFFYPKHPRGITLNGTPVTEYESTTSDRKFYATDAYTDYAINFINEEKSNKNRPFFLYLAHTAPHFPLHAHDEDIAKYRGKYKNGWNELRQARYQRQLNSGLMKPEWKLAPLHKSMPNWKKLSAKQKDLMDLRMATYAAMIDRVDQNLGKLVKVLKENGQYENTIIMFLSDNGACFEGPRLGTGDIVNSAKNPQNQSTWVTYGAWANLSNVPFRQFKQKTHEGGAATPFIMHWPKGIKPQSDWYRDSGSIVDIVPTILDLANVNYPAEINGKPAPKLAGISLKPSFQSKPLKRTVPLFCEHQSNASIIEGDWKLVGMNMATNGGIKPERWELYNLKKDRTELTNLAKKCPEIAKSLAKKWKQWSKANQVYPKK